VIPGAAHGDDVVEAAQTCPVEAVVVHDEHDRAAA